MTAMVGERWLVSYALSKLDCRGSHKIAFLRTVSQRVPTMLGAVLTQTWVLLPDTRHGTHLGKGGPHPAQRAGRRGKGHGEWGSGGVHWWWGGFVRCTPIVTVSQAAGWTVQQPDRLMVTW